MQMPRFTGHLITGLCVLLLASCGGSGDDDVPDFPTVISLGGGEVFPSFLNSSLGVGENRVVWSLIDADENPIDCSAIDYRYYNLNADGPALASSAQARFVQSETSCIGEGSDRSKTVTGECGVYVTYTTLDEPGDWGAELAIS